MALTKVTSGGMDGTFPDDSIVNADINSSAAIALSKLATDPSNASNLASGTVPTARLGSGTASSSVFLAGDSSWIAAGGANTPAFSATVNVSLGSSSSGAWTKVVPDDELFDSDGTYASGKFTPAVAGKYFVYATCGLDAQSASELDLIAIKFYFNGVANAQTFAGWTLSSAQETGYAYTSQIITFNTTDYIEYYVRGLDAGAGNLLFVNDNVRFGAFRIII